MADGREEREEQKKRIEQEKLEREKQGKRQDWLERASPDEWEPERVDS
jgi:hypothetical protein